MVYDNSPIATIFTRAVPAKSVKYTVPSVLISTRAAVTEAPPEVMDIATLYVLLLCLSFDIVVIKPVLSDGALANFSSRRFPDRDKYVPVVTVTSL